MNKISRFLFILFFCLNLQILQAENPSAWGEWSPWSSCSENCGPGKQLRMRSCGGEARGSVLVCEAGSEESKPCNLGACNQFTGLVVEQLSGNFAKLECTIPTEDESKIKWETPAGKALTALSEDARYDLEGSFLYVLRASKEDAGVYQCSAEGKDGTPQTAEAKLNVYSCENENPCLNGGTCEVKNTDKGKEDNCQCRSGFKGTFCEQNKTSVMVIGLISAVFVLLLIVLGLVMYLTAKDMNIDKLKKKKPNECERKGSLPGAQSSRLLPRRSSQRTSASQRRPSATTSSQRARAKQNSFDDFADFDDFGDQELYEEPIYENLKGFVRIHGNNYSSNERAAIAQIYDQPRNIDDQADTTLHRFYSLHRAPVGHAPPPVVNQGRVHQSVPALKTRHSTTVNNAEDAEESVYMVAMPSKHFENDEALKRKSSIRVTSLDDRDNTRRNSTRGAHTESIYKDMRNLNKSHNKKEEDKSKKEERKKRKKSISHKADAAIEVNVEDVYVSTKSIDVGAYELGNESGTPEHTRKDYARISTVADDSVSPGARPKTSRGPDYRKGSDYALEHTESPIYATVQDSLRRNPDGLSQKLDLLEMDLPPPPPPLSQRTATIRQSMNESMLTGQTHAPLLSLMRQHYGISGHPEAVMPTGLDQQNLISAMSRRVFLAQEQLTANADQCIMNRMLPKDLMVSLSDIKPISYNSSDNWNNNALHTKSSIKSGLNAAKENNSLNAVDLESLDSDTTSVFSAFKFRPFVKHMAQEKGYIIESNQHGTGTKLQRQDAIETERVTLNSSPSDADFEQSSDDHQPYTIVPGNNMNNNSNSNNTSLDNQPSSTVSLGNSNNSKHSYIDNPYMVPDNKKCSLDDQPDSYAPEKDQIKCLELFSTEELARIEEYAKQRVENRK